MTQFFGQTRTAKKIIVVDFGFLGDSIHLVPSLWEIKRHYPGAALHTLSAPVGAEILKMAPCVDRAWTFPLTEKSPPWWRHLSILRELRREKFDVAFNFSGADRTLFVTQLLGARRTLAHAAGRKHFWNKWLSAEWVERRPRNLPVYEQRRQVLAAAGLALEPARFDLAVPEEARIWAEAAVPAGSWHFSLSASTPLKEWPLDHWITLAKIILRTRPHQNLVATAGMNPREVTRLMSFDAAIKGSQNFFGLPLPKLAALLQRCRLHVGGDSGVLHLAAALGVPTLTMSRQHAGLAEWMPEGKEHRHVAVPCVCVEQKQPVCLAAGRSACLSSISPEQVHALICQT